MRKRTLAISLPIIFLAIAAGVAVTRPLWAPRLSIQLAAANQSRTTEHHQALGNSATGLVLSESAKESLGLELGPVVLQDYWRSLPVPAEVMEEPGHCEQGVSSTVHGVILKIHAFHGQTVRSGDPLFDVRPTSELLASTQTSLLKSVQEIELVQAELKRIASITESGGIPATRRIEKESELKRFETQRLLLTQELLVRGLSADQIADIIRFKTLIQVLTIRVPGGELALESTSSTANDRQDSRQTAGDGQIRQIASPSDSPHEHGSVYSIERVNVHLGKLVQPGEELCRLARHSQLLIAGRAFERESILVSRAIEQNWPVKAIFEVSDESPVVRDGLSILYSDNVVEPDSRTLRFYIPLTNELVRDRPAANGLSYRSWRFKPGQRARVLLPVEHLLKQIVLPAEAVVKEGTEAFVFRANGKRLERVPVRLLHVDSREALIKSGGTLVPGDVIARNQAYQLQLAMKNAEGGQADPHAGHDHAGHEH